MRNLAGHINDSIPGTVQVNVSWQKPSDDGNSPLSAYHVVIHRQFTIDITHTDIVKSVELPPNQLWLNVAIGETAGWIFSVMASNNAGYNSSTVSTKKYHVIVQSPPRLKPFSLPFRLLLVKTQCSDVTSHVTRDKVREKVVDIINSLSPELHIPVDALHLIDFERYEGEGIALLASVQLPYDRNDEADMEHIGSVLSSWVQNQSGNQPLSVSGVSLTVSRSCPTVFDNNDKMGGSHLCPLSWDSGVLDCRESVASNSDELVIVTIIVAAVLCFVIVLLVIAICIVLRNRGHGQNNR